MLNTLDWLLIAAYFALVFGLAVWASRRDNAARGTSRGYFLAGRNVG